VPDVVTVGEDTNTSNAPTREVTTSKTNIKHRVKVLKVGCIGKKLLWRTENQCGVAKQPLQFILHDF